MIDRAQWIWCDSAPEAENQHACFRRAVRLAAPPTRAVVRCAADTWYRLFVNGTFIDQGPSRGAVAEPAYDTHDIAALLTAGDNVIAFHVHAYGKVKRCSSFIPIRGGLIASVQIDDGEPMLTDGQWKAQRETAYRADTPRHSNHQGFVECFDARAALRGWAEVAFDDSRWSPAVVLGKTADLPPWRRLVPRAVPPLTRNPRTPARILEAGRIAFDPAHDASDLLQLAPAIAAAQRIADPGAVRQQDPRADLPVTIADGYAVFDFAENSAGFVRLKLRGRAGSVVNLAYSESLAYGIVESNKQTVRYVDRVILGDGELDHTIMLPKTFRYLFVHVAGEATFERILHEVRHYPFRWHGRFYSSDQTLDAAWRVGAHTVAISTEDVYMDTPRRERAGWMSDMMPEAIAAYHAFGDYAVARHSLDLFLNSQDQPGLYQAFPTNVRGWLLSRYPSIDPASMPDYNASIALAVRDYVMYSGDVPFAATHWHRLIAVTDYVNLHRNGDGLIEFAVKDYVNAAYILIDWAPFDRNGACTPLNILFHGHLLAMAELAAMLGKAGDERKYRDEARQLAQVVRAKLFDTGRGIFVNSLVNGQLNARAGYQENLLAMIWSLADDAQMNSIRGHLLPDDNALPLWEPEEHFELFPILKRGERPEWDDTQLVPIGSPFFTYFALWALFETGRSTAALNTIRAQYGQCLSRGATSFWEEWNGSKSHSHGWGAGPTAQLLRYVVGIEPTSPGFTTCDVLPDFADLHHASGCVPTPHGIIQAQWKRNAAGAKLDLILPPGITTRAGLPVAAKELKVNGSNVKAGRITTRRGAFAGVMLAVGEHRIETAGNPGHTSAAIE